MLPISYLVYILIVFIRSLMGCPDPSAIPVLMDSCYVPQGVKDLPEDNQLGSPRTSIPRDSNVTFLVLDLPSLIKVQFLMTG